MTSHIYGRTTIAVL